MIMSRTARPAALAALLVASISCGDAVRDSSSPVYLVIDTLSAIRGGPQAGTPSSTLSSDVITNVTSPLPCTPQVPCPTVFSDSGRVVLSISPRNIAVAPTPNNDVTINRYHVEYIRADGRNVPGVDVPYAFDGSVTGTITASGPLTVGFDLVRIVAKEESPLVQLVNSNNFLSLIARISFFGQDRTGNNVSVTGSISITVGNFGDF
jgi:hypothetical protein